MDEKKNLLTREGVKKYEEELAYRKDVKRNEIAQKIKEAKDHGDISENAEFDAARDEQGFNESRIFELENILKNAQIADEEVGDKKRVSFGSTVVVIDLETNEEMTVTIKGAEESNSLENCISNESPLGRALIGCKKGQVVEVECPVGIIKYEIKSLSKK